MFETIIKILFKSIIEYKKPESRSFAEIYASYLEENGESPAEPSALPPVPEPGMVILPEDHPFCPSVLERRESCPGSYWMEKDLPDVRTDAGRHGLYCHGLIATAIKNPTSESTSHLDSEEARLVKKCCRFYRKVVGPHEQWFEVERKVRFMEGEEELYSGTTDIIACRQDGSIVVIDWKTGTYELTWVRDNLQMKAYALAIMQEFSVKSVSVYIYYPNLNKNSRFTFNNESELETEIRRIITTSKSEGSQLNPGWCQCLFCRAREYEKCPEREGD